MRADGGADAEIEGVVVECESLVLVLGVNVSEGGNGESGSKGADDGAKPSTLPAVAGLPDLDAVDGVLLRLLVPLVDPAMSMGSGGTGGASMMLFRSGRPLLDDGRLRKDCECRRELKKTLAGFEGVGGAVGEGMFASDVLGAGMLIARDG